MPLAIPCPDCGNTLRVYVEEDVEAFAFECPQCGRELANPRMAQGSSLDETRITSNPLMKRIAEETGITASPPMDSAITARPPPLRDLANRSLDSIRGQRKEDFPDLLRVLRFVILAISVPPCIGIWVGITTEDAHVGAKTGFACLFLLFAGFAMIHPKTRALSKELIERFGEAGYLVYFICVVGVLAGVLILVIRILAIR